MKIQFIVIIFSLLIFAETLLGQTNQLRRLFIPFLEKESQSNVIVDVSGFFGDGQPCPLEYTNSLSNTNLFTTEEQKTISKAFLKYRNVTTNSGPIGTVPMGLFETNRFVKVINKSIKIKSWVAIFKYTNIDATEEIQFGAGMLAKFRNKSNDGYDLSLTRTGDGSMMYFGEVKHGLLNGLLAGFIDHHAQGVTWDYKFANFDDPSLVEYRHCTNSLVIGKYFMWDSNNNIVLEADFKEPYDFTKNRIDIRMLQ